MNDEPKLLPCPFCGDHMELWDFNSHARHSSAEGVCPLRSHAVELTAWNARATPPGTIRLDAPELLEMVDALKMCRNDLIGWLDVPNIDDDFNTDHSHYALQQAEAAITEWEKMTK